MCSALYWGILALILLAWGVFFYEQERLMATIKEALEVAKDALAKSQATADAVGTIGPAVNALEAKITELLGSGALTPEQQADVDALFDTLKQTVATAEATTATAAATAADAADGIDEAAQQP